MTKRSRTPTIALLVLAHVVGFSGAARADAIDDHLAAAETRIRCGAYARAGAELRLAFDAAVDADVDVAIRSQLLIRVAAAFRAGELWADAAAALELYGSITPSLFDARFRLAEAVQLRAFAAGRLDARLEGDLDLDGLIDGDLDFDGIVDATASVRIPRPDVDPRFGLDLDADGELEVFFGAPLARISAFLAGLRIRGSADADPDARAGIDFGALGVRYRAAFDAAAGAGLSIDARAQLLLRAAAAFRRASLWADAAAALDAYVHLAPPPLDVRLRIGEAAQLRAFAAGDLNARLETGLGLGSLLGRTVSFDTRYGIDFDANGSLDTLVGVELLRIATALGTDLDRPAIRAIDADLPDLDLASALDTDLDTDLRPPNTHLRLIKGLGFGIGSFVVTTGIFGLGLGLRARGINADLDPSLPNYQAQLSLQTKLRHGLTGVLVTGGIAAVGVVTAIVVLVIRGRPDVDLDLDCEARWRLAPGPGLAGLGLERRF